MYTITTVTHVRTNVRTTESLAEAIGFYQAIADPTLSSSGAQALRDSIARGDSPVFSWLYKHQGKLIKASVTISGPPAFEVVGIAIPDLAECDRGGQGATLADGVTAANE